MNDIVINSFNSSIAVKKRMLGDQIILDKIHKYAKICLERLQSGGKIILCGNGGSFADAQHISAEFVSRFMFERAPLPSIVLGVNGSTISAIGNDYGYEQVFSRELNALGTEKDVLIAISTSGDSANVVSAVNIANDLKIPVIALTGSTGGKLVSICDCICVPSNCTARIQESHILIGHVICELVEGAYFDKRKK